MNSKQKSDKNSPLKQNVEDEELNENDDYFLQNSKFYENMYLNQGKAVKFS